MAPIPRMFLAKFFPSILPVACKEAPPKIVDVNVDSKEAARSDAAGNIAADAQDAPSIEEMKLLLGTEFWNSILAGNGLTVDLKVQFRRVQVVSLPGREPEYIDNGETETEIWRVGDIDRDGKADFLFQRSRPNPILRLRDSRFAESVRRRFHDPGMEERTAPEEYWIEAEDPLIARSNEQIRRAFNALEDGLKEERVILDWADAGATRFRIDPVNSDRVYRGSFRGSGVPLEEWGLRVAVWEPDVLQNMSVEIFMSGDTHTVIDFGSYLSEEVRSALAALMAAADEDQ